MRIRLSWFPLGVLLMVTAAHATDHRLDLSGDFSVQRESTLPGFHLALAVVLPPPPSRPSPALPHRHLSVVFDFSSHFGSRDENDTINFMGGLRYTFAWKDDQRAQPFVHVLAGGMHTRNGALRDTDPALGLGAGLDYLWGPDRLWGFRVQGDYIVHSAAISPRFSIGIVKRFK